MVTMTHKQLFSGPKIALYEPDIPQNTAAIIRTCACLGADLEIIEPCGFLLSDKRFKRVVMDYFNEDEIKFLEYHFDQIKKLKKRKENNEKYNPKFNSQGAIVRQTKKNNNMN